MRSSSRKCAGSDPRPKALAQASFLRRRACESRLVGSGASGSEPRWARKGLTGARVFVSVGFGFTERDSSHPVTGSAGLSSRQDHEHTTRGVRGDVGLGSAPLRREKSRRAAPGSAKADVSGPWSANPCWSRLERGDFTRKRRRVRATSPPRGLPRGTVGCGFRPFLTTTRRRGSVDPEPCSRIAVDCSADKHRSGLRTFGHEVAAPRASEAMQAERSF